MDLQPGVGIFAGSVSDVLLSECQAQISDSVFGLSRRCRHHVTAQGWHMQADLALHFVRRLLNFYCDFIRIEYY